MKIYLQVKGLRDIFDQRPTTNSVAPLQLNLSRALTVRTLALQSEGLEDGSGELLMFVAVVGIMKVGNLVGQGVQYLGLGQPDDLFNP